MRFRLTAISMTLDDHELIGVRIFSVFRGISQIWEATTAKRMQIDIIPKTVGDVAKVTIIH